MLILSEENKELAGTKYRVPVKVFEYFKEIINKYPQYSEYGGYRIARNMIESDGVVTMEWLKNMKHYFTKHVSTQDIDYVLGGGLLVKTYVEEKLKGLTAAYGGSERKQHTKSDIKQRGSADNFVGNTGEKQSSSLNISKSLLPKMENKNNKTNNPRIFIITEEQKNKLKEYL